MLMNFFQWTDARLRYLDCLCLFVSNLQPVDSCIILTYCFLSFVVLSYRNYIYVTLCFTISPYLFVRVRQANPLRG